MGFFGQAQRSRLTARARMMSSYARELEGADQSWHCALDSWTLLRRVTPAREAVCLCKAPFQFEGLHYSGIVVPRFIYAFRDGPHTRGARRKGSHQFARIGMITQPFSMIGPRLGSAGFGHDVIDQLIGVRRDDCESAYPLARSSVFPVLPNAAETKRPTILHGDCVRLFGFLPLDCHPFEEPVHRNDALPTPMQAPVRHGSSPPDATGICPPASANSCRRLSLTRRVFNSLIPCSQTPPANEPA
jgi:hypothetical protein